MIPFLKLPKKQTGIIIQERNATPASTEEPEQDSGLIACAFDIIQAIQSKDSKALAMALQAAFQICDAMPHEEGEHTNNYADQNELAGEEN